MEKDNTYVPDETGVYPSEVPLEALPKTRWQRSWPVIACGAGLFSDGYLQSVCSISFAILKAILIYNAGHRFRKHHPHSHLWQRFQKFSSTQERCFNCLRRYRRWPARLWGPQRLLVPKMVPHHLDLHHDRLFCPLRWLIRCTWYPWRHACSPDRLPFPGWYRNWRRIPSWKCRRLRRYRRTQSRAPQPLVRLRHKLHDRHGFRNWYSRPYDRCPHHHRKAPPTRVAHLPRRRSHSPYHSPRFPLSAQGTRGVQSSENDKVPIRADYPLLLETPPYHLYDLVHLRFPRLFVWYLLQFLAVLYHWGFVPTLGLVRLVDTYQFLLYPGRFHWCFPQ
jgi:hypothetical protein